MDSKGNTQYQAMPCAGKKKGKEIKLQKRNISKEQQCRFDCVSKDKICVSKLENGMHNRDGGLNVCKMELEACSEICSTPLSAEMLNEMAKMERLRYDSESKYQEITRQNDQSFKQMLDHERQKDTALRCIKIKQTLAKLNANKRKVDKSKMSVSQLSDYYKESATAERFIRENC